MKDRETFLKLLGDQIVDFIAEWEEKYESDEEFGDKEVRDFIYDNMPEIFEIDELTEIKEYEELVQLFKKAAKEGNLREAFNDIGCVSILDLDINEGDDDEEGDE